MTHRREASLEPLSSGCAHHGALVVVEDEENPFILEIVLLMLESQSVRHAVIAVSASHSSKVYLDFQKDTLVHRSLALQGLKEDLEIQGA